MVTLVAPAAAPDEVEAWLWSERAAAGEAWDPETAEPGPGDEVPEVVPATPAVARWLGAEFQREQLLGEWQHATTQLTRWQGVQLRVLADALDLALADGASRPDTTLSVRSLAAELALAVGMSDRTIEAHMSDAQLMRDRFALVYGAVRDGRLSRPHAQVIAEEGTRLTDEAVRAAYEQMMLQISPQLTTARLRAAGQAIAEQLSPITLAERHTTARAARRVLVRDVGDGMAELWVLLPAPLAHAIHDRITRMGRTIRDAARVAAREARKAAKAELKRAARAEARRAAAEDGETTEPIAEAATVSPAEASRADATTTADETAEASRADATTTGGKTAEVDERTMDQLRTDVLCDILLTGHATTVVIDRDGGEAIDAIRGIVQIAVPMAIITGADTGPPGFLAGRGPIDPESARRIAATATIWDRVLTDPATGNVQATDRRFPTEAQRRFLRARDEHCRFPGAGSRRGGAMQTTPSTISTAGPPIRATSPTCAADTTCSNTRPPGRSNNVPPVCSCGRVRWAAGTPTRLQPHSASSRPPIAPAEGRSLTLPIGAGGSTRRRTLRQAQRPASRTRCRLLDRLGARPRAQRPPSRAAGPGSARGCSRRRSAAISASTGSRGAWGFVSSAKSISPRMGSPAAAGTGARSAGTRDRGTTATPIPARAAASTPLISRTWHVIRHVRPESSSALIAAARDRLGAWYAMSGTGLTGSRSRSRGPTHTR